MRISLAGVVSVVTIIVVSSLVAAQTPVGVEPGVWAKVEAQLDAQGLQSARAKADRDLPVEVAKLLPTGGLIGDYAEFGRAITVDGDLMVVGANDHDQDDDAGAAFVFQRGEGGADAWGQVAKLMASDGAQNDEFGSSVSVSGDTVVVGAPYDDDNGDETGSAYVFVRDQSGPDVWGQVAKLTASGGEVGDNFGVGVSISGDTVVVGAKYDDVDGIKSGSAYIFERNSGGVDEWGPVAILVPSDGDTWDFFGTSVAISGDTVVVGANQDDDNGADSGSVYIFQRDHGRADAWGQVAKIWPSDGTVGEDFGFSVSISGDTVVVGTPLDADNDTSSGSAYIFERDHGGVDEWGEVAKLVPSDGAQWDRFGKSVAISGDTVVVGALGDDDNGAGAGSAYTFGRDTGGINGWGQVGKLLALDGANGDFFGFSVSISGDTVVVGAHQDDDNGPDSGSAYIFGRDHGGMDEWGQVKKKVAPGYLSAQEDRFGVAVAIYDDTIVVGAYKDDENGIDSGSAYVFCRSQGGEDAWGKVVKLVPSDGASNDWFGTSVAISGETVVVGAPQDYDNGFSSGSAYIFDRNQGGPDAWGQVAKIMPLDGANGDYFGYSVAISGDTVVIGALRDDDNGFHSGSVYIFERDQGGVGAWGQVAELFASDGSSEDMFGRAVAISGDTIVVGALSSHPILHFTGSAYIFERDPGDGNAWWQVAKLTASDGTDTDEFGRVVSISGDTAIVGARFDDDDGAGSGSAYIFERNQGGADSWGLAAKLTASEGAIYDNFGSAVAISGDAVFVGAVWARNNGDPSGSAYLFGRNQGGTNAWGQVAKMIASDGAGDDSFGSSISVSGGFIVVGAPGDDDIGLDSGSAYVFDLGHIIFVDGFESGDTNWWSGSQP